MTDYLKMKHGCAYAYDMVIRLSPFILTVCWKKSFENGGNKYANLSRATNHLQSFSKGQQYTSSMEYYKFRSAHNTLLRQKKIKS